MLVELGPFPATDVQRWARFARRLIVELRTNPDDLEGIATEDFLRQWSSLIEQWAATASSAATANGTSEASFRWSETIDCELAEFLLHGMERILHSPSVQARITEHESNTYRPFTMHVVRAFVDGLSTEGQTHAHYVDQVRALFGAALD
ncbi:MAG: hypothetical protein GY724_14850 [Actinomycetia bacterium]|nr:hypothetical protein [Actinomycetes bacterium]MCP4223878.1 hypothetical protein [Actinomycetes bacterium]MCP5030731.1 hypothetical protein [Actinomycetes bacterium]